LTRGNKGADGVRTTLICVDTYDGGAMSGRVYVPGMDGAGVFENLMQLLALIDGMPDETIFPKTFSAGCESAGAVPGPVTVKDTSGRKGRLCTFEVKIMFRQNSSWQGRVAWIESGSQESFRSVLELVLLINNALEATVNKLAE